MGRIGKTTALAVLSGAFLLGSIAVVAVPPEQAQAATSLYTWKSSVAPRYVKVVGKAKVVKKPTRGKIRYSKLDGLGRTRTVRGNITYKLVKKSAGWRETMTSDDPSGWGHNRRVAIKLYNGRVYHGYLWNRSHLIADSLGGHAIRRNLVTGTRTQNVGANDGNGGMAYCETRVRDWLYAHHKGSVYYSARPVYKGSELVCRSVVVDMKSSDGSINQRVVVYNAANGFKIDYGTGGCKKAKAKSYSKSTVKVKKAKSSKRHSSGSKKVWITATGKRYHSRSSCSGLSRARSKWTVTISRARAKGLTACHICY